MQERRLTIDGSAFTEARDSWTESDLAMPRAKRRSLVVALAYRLMKLGRVIPGRRRLLRMCLNAGWLFRQFSYELSGEVFGPSFHCSAMALTEEALRRWIPPGGSVIDIGCGTGRWCRVAARHARSVVGIDHNAASIAAARQISQADNIEFMVGDVTRELVGRRFDLALLVHVLEHVENVDPLLVAVRGIASTMLVEVPDFEADPLNSVRKKLGCPYYTDGDHVREYTLAMLRRQLERCGWRIHRHENHGGAILAVAIADDKYETAEA
jgi:SAM-dependent methyltransferase